MPRNYKFWAWFDTGPREKLGARRDTFAKMFEHLDQFDGIVTIVETGCARRPPAEDDSWTGDGCSTLLFDKYVQLRDSGTVYTVDLSQKNADACKQHVSWRTQVNCEDSVKFLEWFSHVPGHGGIHLLYLDSFDYDATNPIPSAVHHHRELMAAMPIITSQTMVVVDDSPASMDADSHAEIGGKGFLVARHMALVGADMRFCQYQAGWTNVRQDRPQGDQSLLTLMERARKHVEADRVVAAEQLYRLILGMTTPPKSPTSRVAHGEACMVYARLALARNKLGSAADWYREAINADPLGTDYRLELVTKCFLPMGNLDSALTEAERATRIAPDYPKTWKILGGVHHEMSNLTKAMECYDKRLLMEPNDPDGLMDRAMCSLSVPDYDITRECCELAMGTEREPDAWHCLAMVAYREHRHEDAIELYDKAIALGCDDPNMAHWNKSLAMHAIGQYRAGWIEHEHREHNRANPALYLPMKRFTLPRWTGQPPQDPIDYGAAKKVADGVWSVEVPKAKLIHVHYEAGAGDNLACCRYLNVLLALGYRVRYETAPEMVTLMQNSFPEVEIVPKAPDYPGAMGIEAFDYHIPIGSLPHVLETDIDSVPWSGPYLKPTKDMVVRYRDKLSGLNKHALTDRKIGFCWSSGIRLKGAWIKEFGMRKSMHFDKISPLVKACWDQDIGTPISLQIGPERDQEFDIIDMLPARPSWDETAGLIAHLDLVITVDTSIAHLAGAMGKPVWVMVQKDGTSWHFMCYRPGASWNEASPWYPSARIFRPETYRPHDWSSVIEKIAHELDKWKAAQIMQAAK